MVLICTHSPSPPASIFLWLYHPTNSHVSLTKPLGTSEAIYCYLNISTPVGNKIVNLNFTQCSDNAILYLYQSENSHVSKDKWNIGICFAPPFNKIIKPIWSTTILQETNTTTFVLGLYNETNSHVTINKNENGVKWYLYFKLEDTEPPQTKIEFPKNGGIISSTVFEVRFKDYDNGGLLCFYQIGNNPPKKRECNSTVYVNAYDCEKNPCTVKSIVVDYASNVAEDVVNVTLKNVPLLIQIEVPEKIVIPISNPIAKFKIKVKNTLNKELKLNITAVSNSIENIPKAFLPKVILNNNDNEIRITLKPGEEKEINVTVIGYRIGNYLITFDFTTDSGFSTQRSVVFVVSAVIAGTTIAVIERVLLPLLYLLP